MWLPRTLLFAFVLLLPMAAQAQTQEVYSRAEMLNSLIAINNGIQQIARTALERSENQRIQQLAKDLLADHQALGERVAEVATDLSLDPDQTVASQRFKNDAVRAEQRLRELSGQTFEKVFLDQQAESHLQAIGLVEGRLQPDAQQPALKSLLQKTRRLLGEHLTQINRLRQGGW
jgi:putative membrane protein